MSEWEAVNTFKAFGSRGGRERGKVLPAAEAGWNPCFHTMTQIPSSHAVLKPQFPLLYYDKAQSNMAHKALLDVVPANAAAGICPLCSIAEC